MNMFIHTVTVYNTEIVRDDDLHEFTACYITVLRGVLLDAVKAVNVRADGNKSEGADSVSLYIPFSVHAQDGLTGAPKKYLSPSRFWELDNKNGFWTLSAGKTFFTKGESVASDADFEEVSRIYGDVYRVTSVAEMNFGYCMEHFEVKGA